MLMPIFKNHFLSWFTTWFLTNLKAYFGGQLSKHIPAVWAASNQDITAAVNELCDSFHTQCSTKLLHGRSEDDQVLVDEFTVLRQD